jgi:hypothetical protein
MSRDRDPWAWSREELAAYTALESSEGVPLRTIRKNLEQSGMSPDSVDGVIQSVVDKSVTTGILKNLRNEK